MLSLLRSAVSVFLTSQSIHHITANFNNQEIPARFTYFFTSKSECQKRGKKNPGSFQFPFLRNHRCEVKLRHKKRWSICIYMMVTDVSGGRWSGEKIKHTIRPFVYFYASQGENIFRRLDRSLPWKILLWNFTLFLCASGMQQLPIISALHVLQHVFFVCCLFIGRGKLLFVHVGFEFPTKNFLRLAKTRVATRWFKCRFLNDVLCESKVSPSIMSCQSPAALSVHTAKLGKSTSSASDFFWHVDGKPHSSLKLLWEG